MKKTIAIIVIIVVASSVISAATKNTTPSTGTAQGSATYSAETAANYKYQTSSSNRMVTIGTKSVEFEAPVLVTSFGQSTDGSMIEQVMKRLKTVSYAYNPTATGADLDGVKTVVIAVGNSTKGLGAARRGSLSDAFADMVLPLSSYMVVKEDGNEDSKFTSYASLNSIPITLVYGSKDTVDAFRLIFN